MPSLVLLRKANESVAEPNTVLDQRADLNDRHLARLSVGEVWVGGASEQTARVEGQ